MTTPEQQALQLAAQAWCTPATSGLEMDVNLATAVAEKFAPIIAENAALKAELAAIKGAGEPVAFMVRRGDWPEGVTQPVKGSEPPIWADTANPLYTRPCVPLTDEQIEAGREAVFSTNNPFCPCDSKTMRKAVRWAEAAHNIKGAKP